MTLLEKAMQYEGGNKKNSVVPCDLVERCELALAWLTGKISRKQYMFATGTKETTAQQAAVSAIASGIRNGVVKAEVVK